MHGRYFSLTWDVGVPGRWYLDHPVDQQGQEIQTWLFRRGEPAHIEGSIRIPLYKPGRPTDYTELAGASIPVVHFRVARLFRELAPTDVQLLPVTVDSSSDQHYLVNITRVIKCIDEQASGEVKHWTLEDGRPEKLGTYRAVYGLRIDPMKAGGAKMFRAWGWTVSVIISEEIKDAMERAGVSGAKFEQV